MKDSVKLKQKGRKEGRVYIIMAEKKGRGRVKQKVFIDRNGLNSIDKRKVSVKDLQTLSAKRSLIGNQFFSPLHLTLCFC